MQNGKRPAILLPLVALLWLIPRPAAAFTYPEHAYITRRALERYLKDDAFLAFVDGLQQRLLMLGKHACGTREKLLEYPPPRDCFTLFDLPALSGDHAPSSPTLVARWFGPGNKDNGLALLANAVEGISGVDSAGEPELSAVTKGPDIPAFLRAVRAYTYDGADLDLHGIDTSIAGADLDYVKLAVRGRAHFRLTGVSATAAASKLEPNAVAKYARMHYRALIFAAIAKSTPPIQNADEKTAALYDPRPMWLGLALIHELFAWHYLQDAVASGHIVTPISDINNATAKDTHDRYNERGIDVFLPQALCSAAQARSADFPRLDAKCRSHSDAKLHGDHALVSGHAAASKDDVTLETATLVLQQSLDELLRSGDTQWTPETKPSPYCFDGVASCLGKLPPGEDHATFCESQFEIHCNEPLAIRALMNAGALSAPSMLPESVEAHIDVKGIVAGSLAGLDTSLYMFIPLEDTKKWRVGGVVDFSYRFFFPRTGPLRFYTKAGARLLVVGNPRHARPEEVYPGPLGLVGGVGGCMDDILCVSAEVGFGSYYESHALDDPDQYSKRNPFGDGVGLLPAGKLSIFIDIGDTTAIEGSLGGGAFVPLGHDGASAVFLFGTGFVWR